MFVRHLFRVRSLVVFAVALLFAVATYGFAASNTVPATVAGDGENTISGFTVSNVRYTLDTNNPAQISQVALTLSPLAPATTTVKVQFQDSASAMTGSWYTCAMTGSNAVANTSDWSCTGATNAQAVNAYKLRVVAHQ